jgi:hypothetical protein
MEVQASFTAEKKKGSVHRLLKTAPDAGKSSKNLRSTIFKQRRWMQ